MATHEIGCTCGECAKMRKAILARRMFAPLVRFHEKRGEKARAESARRALAKCGGDHGDE